MSLPEHPCAAVGGAGEQVVESAIETLRAGVHEVGFDGPTLAFAEGKYLRVGLCLAERDNDFVLQKLAHCGAKHHVAAQIGFVRRFVAIEHHDVAGAEVGRRGRFFVFVGRGKCHVQVLHTVVLLVGFGGEKLEIGENAAHFALFGRGALPRRGKSAGFFLGTAEAAQEIFAHEEAVETIEIGQGRCVGGVEGGKQEFDLRPNIAIPQRFGLSRLVQVLGRKLFDEMAHAVAGKLHFARHDLVADAEGFAQAVGRIRNGPNAFLVGIFGVEEVTLQTTVRLLESVVAHGHVEHELDLVLVVRRVVVFVDFPALLFHHDGAVGLHEVDTPLQTEHFAKEGGFDAHALFVGKVELVFEGGLAQTAEIALLGLCVLVETLSIDGAGGEIEGVVGEKAACGVNVIGMESVHFLVEHLSAQVTEQGGFGGDEGVELFQHVPRRPRAGGADALRHGGDADQIVGLDNDEFGEEVVVFATEGHEIELRVGFNQGEQIGKVAAARGIGGEGKVIFGVVVQVGGADEEGVREHLIDHHAPTFFGERALGRGGGEVFGQEGGEFGRNGGLFQAGDQVGQGAEVAGQAGGELVERRLVGASPTHAEIVGGMIERGGESELRVQIVQTREGAGERSRRIGRGFVHQFHKKAIGHAATAANVVGFGLQAATNVVVIVVGRGEFHSKAVECMRLAEFEVVDDGAAHDVVETAHELLAHHGELGAECRGAHFDPQRLFAHKAGGGVRGDGAAGRLRPSLYGAVFEKGRFQSIFAEEHAQHVPHHFSPFAFHRGA